MVAHERDGYAVRSASSSISSPSVIDVPRSFILEQPRLKVYRRAGDPVLIPPARIRDAAPTPIVRPTARREPAWATAGSARARTPRELARPGTERLDHLLLLLPVGVVLIDPAYDISFLNAAARRLLAIHGPAVGNDFVHLANQLPSEELRAAVAAAVRGETRVVTRPMPVEADDDGGRGHVQLVLQPYRQSATERIEAVLVTVIDVSEPVRERRSLEVRGWSGPSAARRDPGRRPAPTEREHELLALLADGASNEDIAIALGVGIKTVEGTIRRPFDRYGHENRTQLARYAMRQGWLTSDPDGRSGPSRARG